MSIPIIISGMTQDEIQKQFGQIICSLRKKQGLTQAKLAEIVNLNDETISNIERGLASTRIKTAVKLAEALQVDIKDLFDFPSKNKEEAFKQEALKIVNDIFIKCDTQTINAIVKTALNIAELKV